MENSGGVAAAVRVGDADLPKGQQLPELPLTPGPACLCLRGHMCFWESITCSVKDVFSFSCTLVGICSSVIKRRPKTISRTFSKSSPEAGAVGGPAAVLRPGPSVVGLAPAPGLIHTGLFGELRCRAASLHCQCCASLQEQARLPVLKRSVKLPAAALARQATNLVA